MRLFSHLDTRLDSWLQKFGQAHRYASSGSDARKDRGNGFPVPMVFFPKVGRSVPQINGGGWCVFFWPNFHHIILKIGSNWCGICAVSVLYMVVWGGFCIDWGVERVTHFGGLKLEFCCWLCWACPVWCIVKPFKGLFFGGASKMIVSCFTDWVGFPQIGWECLKQHNIENYPPGNLHIPLQGTFEDDSPFPMVGYVSFLEGIENIPKKSLNVSLVVRILVDCNG